MVVPEKELIRREFTVRELRLPGDTKLTRQSLLRWVCLSIGLLSPDESRHGVLSVMDSFLSLQFAGKAPTVAELAEASGQPEKAVRYHLHRLEGLGLAEASNRRYSLRMDRASNRLNLSRSFKEHYSENLVQSLSSIEAALGELQRSYEG